MDRRVFLQWVGLGWLGSVLPGCVAQVRNGTNSAIATSPPPALAQNPASPSAVTVGSVSQLDQTGYLLNQGTPLGKVMVVRDPANPAVLDAVNPTCTHEGCLIDWDAGQREFHCPCHGARFAANGQVLQGPARTSLETYSARIENDAILVSSSSSQAASPQSSSDTSRSNAAARHRDEDERYDDDDHGDDHDGGRDDDRDDD